MRCGESYKLGRPRARPARWGWRQGVPLTCAV